MSSANERGPLRSFGASAIIFVLGTDIIGLSKFIGRFFYEIQVESGRFLRRNQGCEQDAQDRIYRCYDRACCRLQHVYRVQAGRHAVFHHLFFSALTGAIIGPVYGFVASFLGDLAGFLYNSGGYPYYPWIGIAMGTVSAISGLVMGFGGNSKGALATKIAVVCALTFAIATVGINTTAFWITYNQMKVPYMAYLSTRLFVQGQIWNSLFNYALLFASLPVIRRFSAKSDADGEK